MQKKIDLDKAIELAGNKFALARVLGLSRQAVQRWKEIPELQQYRLRELKPEWFK